MDDYSRLEHLKMVQAVITRMAQNSFLLKGWSVTLVTAMVSLAISDRNRAFAVLALFPALAFWGLDAFYLRQERLFRAVHDAVCAKPGEASAFSLSTEGYTDGVPSWLETLFAPTVMALHVIVVAGIAALLISGLIH